MGVVGVVAVLLPFLELAPASDAVPGEVLLHGGDGRLVVRIHAQGARHIEVVLEQVPDDLLVEHHPVLARTVLGRPALGRDQPAIGQLLEVVLPEGADLLDQRIGDLAQVGGIAGEGPVLVEVLGVPGAGRDVPFPAVAAEDVLAGARGPAARGRPERRPGRPPAGFELGDHVVDQRQLALREVGGLGRPVVHLQVDVVVVVAGPGRPVAVIPQPLQVGGQAAGARAARQQVASVLEHGQPRARDRPPRWRSAPAAHRSAGRAPPPRSRRGRCGRERAGARSARCAARRAA